MAAPGDLDQHQRRAEPQPEGDGRAVPPPPGRPVDQPGHAQVGGRPDGLEQEHRGTEEGEQVEDELGPGRVDRRDRRVVDPRAPGRGQPVQGPGAGRVQERVHPLAGHPAVPQVAPQVVREVGQHREQGQPNSDGADPEQDPLAPVRRPAAGQPPPDEQVAGPGGSPQRQGGDRRVGRPGQVAQGDEGPGLQGQGGGQAPHGRTGPEEARGGGPEGAGRSAPPGHPGAAEGRR